MILRHQYRSSTVLTQHTSRATTFLSRLMAMAKTPRVRIFQRILIKEIVHFAPDAANGVLFSAHFDSVSTGPGATDNGMSVSALLQMIKYLATHRPRRTAVFNINNGEEDGLHGAHASVFSDRWYGYRLYIVCFWLNRFLEHPWSNLTSTFLNFEGAGAGG